MSTKRFYSLGDVADHFGCRSWQVARLYERKILPEPARLGNLRVVLESDLEEIGAALKRAGYLKAELASSSK